MFVSEQEQPTNVYKPVFLRTNGRTIAKVEYFADEAVHRPCLHARFTVLDEVCILGESAGVEKKRDAVVVAHLLDLVEVEQAYGLPAAGVVGDGHHAQGDPVGPDPINQRSQLLNIHIPFERMA